MTLPLVNCIVSYMYAAVYAALSVHECYRVVNSLKPNLSNYYTLAYRPTYHFNLWHSGTLALSPERQSARMSEIKNGRLLDLYGAEYSKCNHMMALGFKGLTLNDKLVAGWHRTSCSRPEWGQGCSMVTDLVQWKRCCPVEKSYSLACPVYSALLTLDLFA